MKKVISFIKEHIVLGIVVIVPIAIVFVVFSGTLKKLMALTTPITDNIDFGGTLIKSLIAGIIIVLVLGTLFFISGVLLKTYLGNRFRNWLDDKILSHVPFYDTMKNLTGQITGFKEGNYAVVEVKMGENSGVILGIMTETLTDGRCVVYCPFSPLINIGQIHVVEKKNVKVLDLSLKDFTDIITKIGFESGKIQKKYNNGKDFSN